jgi:5-methyltetrahydrofolate--homocysteine methyltransferase
MARALILGQHIAVGEMTRQALAGGIDPKAIIFKGLIPGMDVVGEKFRRNEYYVPQVLLSARAMYAGLDLLKPLLTKTGVDEYLGTVVIGTAQGDLHDIGKNLVAMMLEGAGFRCTIWVATWRRKSSWRRCGTTAPPSLVSLP